MYVAGAGDPVAVERLGTYLELFVCEGRVWDVETKEVHKTAGRVGLDTAILVLEEVAVGKLGGDGLKRIEVDSALVKVGELLGEALEAGQQGGAGYGLGWAPRELFVEDEAVLFLLLFLVALGHVLVVDVGGRLLDRLRLFLDGIDLGRLLRPTAASARHGEWCVCKDGPSSAGAAVRKRKREASFARCVREYLSLLQEDGG